MYTPTAAGIYDLIPEDGLIFPNYGRRLPHKMILDTLQAVIWFRRCQIGIGDKFKPAAQVRPIRKMLRYPIRADVSLCQRLALPCGGCGHRPNRTADQQRYRSEQCQELAMFHKKNSPLILR